MITMTTISSVELEENKIGYESKQLSKEELVFKIKIIRERIKEQGKKIKENDEKTKRKR